MSPGPTGSSENRRSREWKESRTKDPPNIWYPSVLKSSFDNVHFLLIVVLRKVVYFAERRGARLLIDWHDGTPEGIDKSRLTSIHDGRNENLGRRIFHADTQPNDVLRRSSNALIYEVGDSKPFQVARRGPERLLRSRDDPY